MEAPPVPPRPRRRLLAKFTGASLIGLAVSFTILRLGMALGLHASSARLIGLLVAMHVTFLINGRFVFRALTRERFLGLWGAYVANSAIGNSCNYLVFLAVMSIDHPLPGKANIAFVAGSLTAWTINFLGARFVVFGEAGGRIAALFKKVVLGRPVEASARASAEPGPFGR